jgi:FkbH-like protein
MNSPSLSEIQSLLDTTQFDDMPKLGIAVLRNVVVDPIVPYLRYGALKQGFDASVKMGEFDNVVQDAMGETQGLLDNQTDCVVVFLRLEGLSWQLARGLPTLTKEAIQAEISRIRDTIAMVLAGIRKQSKALILWMGFELPPQRAFGILDAKLAHGQRSTVNALNDELILQLNTVNSAYFIDLNAQIAELGSAHFYDPRYWHIGRAPYTRAALGLMARDCMTFVAALKGKAKKCLVLDCDNTLWGGIVGEDGLEGIKLGSTHPGSSFLEFQQEVVNLYHRGILIALCSKNNADDVWEVFDNHPDIQLKRTHIATAQINWDDKVTNLRRIAERLNIGLDSIVFADDSDFEISLVREQLPEVTTLHLPKERQLVARDLLAGLGLFDGLTFSDEDRNRGEMYQAEASRKELAEQITDIQTYLASLEMQLVLRSIDARTLPRVAQLTQKTNQFNLTTRRYTESEVAEAAKQGAVYSVQLKDRFGDYGIIGVIVLGVKGDVADIDTFLLSCRALGRGVEGALLEYATEWAVNKGCSAIAGTYIPTKKNGQVEHFYPNHGFVLDDGARSSTGGIVYMKSIGNETAKQSPKFLGTILYNE